jgi:hypothetical protein
LSVAVIIRGSDLPLPQSPHSLPALGSTVTFDPSRGRKYLAFGTLALEIAWSRNEHFSKRKLGSKGKRKKTRWSRKWLI